MKEAGIVPQATATITHASELIHDRNPEHSGTRGFGTGQLTLFIGTQVTGYRMGNCYIPKINDAFNVLILERIVANIR